MKKNKKRIKENPIMGSKTYKNNLKSDDESEIKSFIIIVVIIAAILLAIYFLTELINKKEAPKENETKVTINYDKISIGTLLNRPYNKYYVLLFSSKNSNSALYTTMLSSYMQKKSDEDYIKIYYCDLNNNMNKPYYNVNDDNKSNPEAKKISELDLGEITLIEIENGEITNYIEDYNQIEKVLN